MKKFGVLFLIISGFIFLSRWAYSIEEYKTESDEARAYNVTRTVKTVEGLHFSVQEDHPIEKVAGIIRPVDSDSYVALKFNKLSVKMEEMRLDLTKKIDELAQKVDALSKKVDKLASEPITPAGNQTSPTQP